MFYFLHGSDTDKAIAKADDMVAALLKKKPDAAFFKMTDENWSEAALAEYMGGQGLFSQKYIVLLSGVFGNKEYKEVLVKKLKELKESENIFIMREGVVDKTSLTKIEKQAEKVQQFELKEESAKEVKFNVFSLTDALGRRDRKSLWTLFLKAQKAGVEAENIHGTLFWQVKSLIVARETKDAKQAGMHPFAFSKAQGFSKNFKKEELLKLSGDLVSIYHEAHRGMYDLNIALERFVLTI
ncbi:MAG TPA: hypothetical protein VJH55_01800 [Candidatus Paceibacterota bacterium]